MEGLAEHTDVDFGIAIGGDIGLSVCRCGERAEGGWGEECAVCHHYRASTFCHISLNAGGREVGSVERGELGIAILE